MGKKSVQQSKRQRVSFSFQKQDASHVSLVGDFNDWNPKRHPMKQDSEGTWTKAVMLVPGTYEYKFWVDGAWIADPENAPVCKNCFGTLNNRITVQPKTAERRPASRK
jgi:1,4-alpha-glucan branching enzyme